MKSTARCEFCGSRKVDHLFDAQDLDCGVAGTFRMFECKACRVVFQFPKPSKKQIQGFYSGQYISFNYRKSFLNSLALDFFSLSELFFIQKKFRDKNKISMLDIGCGDGSTLLFYKKHIPSLELHGFELDIRKKDLIDPRVHCEFGSLNKFNGKLFDVVRMSQLIEHDPAPIATLKKVYGLLKPGGYLIGETPNYHCLDFRIFKGFWGCLHVPRHLYLFNEDFMRRQLEKTGFRDVKIAYVPRAVGMTNGMLYFLKYGFLDKAKPYSIKPHVEFSLARFLTTFFAIPVLLWQCLFGKSAGMKFKAQKPL